DFGRLRSVEGSHPDTGAPALLRDVSWAFDGDLAVRETRTALDWSGRVTTRRDTLDALGRTARSTFEGADGVARHQVLEHSSAGQVVARSKLFSDGDTPIFETHRFDSRGRPVESTTADGDRITYAYQAPARVRTVTSEGTGREKVRVIDYMARNGRLEPASVLHGNGQRIDFHRDALGRLLVASDAFGGDLMRQSFDSLGRTVETWNPAAGSVHLAYGPGGLLHTRVASGPGSTRTYAYDALGRLVQEVAQAGGETETIDYAWDDAARGALGRLASIDSSKGWGYDYDYDAAGRVRRQDLRVHRRVWTLEQRFDPAGRPLSVRFPDGSETTTAYGDAGTLESVDFTEIDGVTRRLVEVTGRRADTRPSQVRLGPLTLSMEWTAEGLLDAREAHVPAGFVDQESVERTSGRFVDGVTGVLAPIWDQSFTHDAAGQLVAAAGGYGTETFLYSDGGDLLERGGLHYEYDASGRVVRVAADGGGVPFSGAYDDGGRLVERHTALGHDVLRYGARERLEEVTRDGATVATFLYDHLGRRLHKEESGVETFYIGEDYEETVHAGGTQWTRYLEAPKGGFATVSRGVEVGREGYAANGDQFFLTDHLGHVRRVFDGAGQLGTVVNYTPFGEMWHVDGPLNFRRGFAGLELDRSTGLYDNRARYYDAGLGRFITADSRLGGGVLELSAFNRYAFGANDPTYFTDPTGYSFFDAIGDAFESAADWVADNADVLAGLTVSVVQVGVGVAILAASPTLGKALIGAGFESGFYAATHFGDFSWDGYGNAQLAGVDRGLGISSKINAASKVASVLGAGAGSVASRAASATVAGVDGA
ncbi:MAG: RHS repeat-associated core domain-containing protein, partial [Acidobacteriota bacterium]